MSVYPEHEKLSKIIRESNAVGRFIDVGLPQMGLELYERVTRPCEMNHRHCKYSTMHTKEERETIVDGRVQYVEWVPTHRTISNILAEWFGIDKAKLESEKEQILSELRAMYKHPSDDT